MIEPSKVSCGKSMHGVAPNKGLDEFDFDVGVANSDVDTARKY